eukprot:426862-Pleurochrysis_carterae.AAC.1
MALGVLVQGEERGAAAAGIRVGTLPAELRVCSAASFDEAVELRVAGSPPDMVPLEGSFRALVLAWEP